MIFLSILFFFMNGCFAKAAVKPVLTVGICADTPPFSFRHDNSVSGFEIDLIKEIAKDLGYLLNLMDMDFASLIPALKNKKIDSAIALLGKTPERQEQVLFTKPYLSQKLSFVSRQKWNLDTFEKWAQSGLKIGVQVGSLHHQMLLDAKDKKAKIYVYDRLKEGLQDLSSLRLDAFLLDEGVAKKIPFSLGFSITTLENNPISASIALANKDLQKRVDESLARLTKNGTLRKLEKKWFTLPFQDKKTEKMFLNLSFKNYAFILEGLKVNLFYAFFSLMGGAFIAIILTFLRRSHIFILSFFAKSYVSIFRGTPLILQLWFVYFGLGSFFAKPWQAGIFIFSLNSGAYLSEVFRSGIESIDQTQFDAGYVLGLSKTRILWGIIFPQVLRQQLPALINECCDLLKESALVSTITESDIMRRANLVSAQTYEYIMPYVFAGLCYYVIILLLTAFSTYLAKNLQRKAVV